MRNRSHENDIILAGLPRSGSTLTCQLINSLPDAVALNEPMNVFRFPELPDRAAMCNEISQFFEGTRLSLKESRTAVSKHMGGVVSANFVSPTRDHSGLRKPLQNRGSVTFDKSFSPDGILVVKHCAAFAALMPEAMKRFRTYATVRNPVAVLSSWNSVSMPIQRGHVPAAENIDAGLRARLASIPERLERQVHLLSWFFDRFNSLPVDRIIRYEDVIASGGSRLSIMAPSAANLQEPLVSKNRNSVYDRELTLVLVERLLRERDASFWRFYTRESVEAAAN